MDIKMCEKCQEKFDKQNGELRLLDMCEDCKKKHIAYILEDMEVYEQKREDSDRVNAHKQLEPVSEDEKKAIEKGLQEHERGELSTYGTIEELRNELSNKEF